MGFLGFACIILVEMEAVSLFYLVLVEFARYPFLLTILRDFPYISTSMPFQGHNLQGFFSTLLSYFALDFHR